MIYKNLLLFSIIEEVGIFFIGRAWDPSILVDHWAISFVQLW